MASKKHARNPRANAEVCVGHRKDGTPCTQPQKAGSDKCHWHGGASPSGVAHGRFEHGRYSNDLAGSLQEDYKTELKDPKLTALRDEIALARSYISEILRTGESGKSWRDVQNAFWELDEAIRGGDTDGVRQAMRRLHGIVKEGRHDWKNRSEIMQRTEQVRKLVDSEHKHLIDSRLALTQEQMATTLAAYVDVVRKEVTGDQLVRINRGLTELVHGLSQGAGGTPSLN